MATITTGLNHDQIEDLVGDINTATVTSTTGTQITYSLTYRGDDLPHASTLVVGGTFSGNGQPTGTVSSVSFLDAGGASLMTITGLSMDLSQVQSMIANPDTFEDFVDHLGTGVGPGDDDLDVGDDHGNDMHGGGGDDDMLGGGGDDDLTGGPGDDRMDGGSGRDDTAHFEDGGKVTVNLTAGTSRGQGNDTLVNIENVVGSHGNDHITGDDDNNELDAGEGNDKIFGVAGNDDLIGGKGNDQLDGGAGDDFLDGGEGNDKLAGGEGNDEIDGGRGNDNIIAGNGANSVLGGDGNDKITAGDGDDVVDGEDGNDTIMTGGGNDVINGGDDKDNIKAGDGNDFIDGGDGDDNMAGGAGDDTYVVSGAKDKIVEQAGQGSDTVISSGSFSLEKLGNVENIELAGLADSSAKGNAGANVLNGNEGSNTLTGGAGNDVFVFDNLGGIDTITDFTSGADKIAFDDEVFTSLAGSIDLGANLVTGTAALDANDFLVFDSTTGALYYDQDGSGTGSAVQIATLGGGATLTGADLALI